MDNLRTFDLLDRYRTLFPEKKDAFAAKIKGQWQPVSSTEYIQAAEEMCLGLLALGLKPGDRVATISNNRPEWNFTDMGLALAGLIHVPIFTTLTTEGYQAIIEHAGVKWAFVADKNLAKSLASLVDIYTFDNVEGQKHWTEVRDKGRTASDEIKAEAKKIKDGIKPEDWVTLIYTSGTTGTSKGVMLSHRNLMSNAMGVAGIFQLKPEHRYLSILPICHVGERMGNYQSQYSGCSIYYAESIATVAADIKDVKPHAFGAVPRILEKVYDKIVAKGQALTGIKKKLFFWALELGLKYKLNGANGAWYEFQLKIANKLIFSKWREALGGNLIYIGIGGAALQPRLERVFWAAGVRLVNMYGLTETSPTITINRISGPQLRLGTVGAVLPGVQVRIAEDGEILCKGPNVMLGYFRDEKATADVLKDGWFHTGDIGKIEDGFLSITDRKKEIFKLSNGKYVAPQAIENVLKESVYIDAAMIIGEGEKFAGALIVPNKEMLEQKAKETGWGTKWPELLKEKEVYAFYRKIIDGYNTQFGEDEKVKRFQLVKEEWTPDNGFLSPTLKLKRKVILKHYDAEVGEIFRKQAETV